MIASQLNKDNKDNYQMAYNALQASKLNLYDDTTDADMLTEKDVNDIYYQLIESAKINIANDPVTDEVAINFRKHLYKGLKFLLKNDRLKEADQRTSEIIFYIAGRKKDGLITVESIQKFSCSALQEIDAHWRKDPTSKEKFGFRVQKEIWQRNGSPILDSPDEMWIKFFKDLGWLRGKGVNILERGKSGLREGGLTWVLYDQLSGFGMDAYDAEEVERGNLPFSFREQENQAIFLKRDGHLREREGFIEHSYDFLMSLKLNKTYLWYLRAVNCSL